MSVKRAYVTIIAPMAYCASSQGNQVLQENPTAACKNLAGSFIVAASAELSQRILTTQSRAYSSAVPCKASAWQVLGALASTSQVPQHRQVTGLQCCWFWLWNTVC